MGKTMNTSPSLLHYQPVTIFCGLTVLLSFATYLLPLPRESLPFLMVLIPACMALALTAISEGKAGVRTLLGKLGQWRISPQWLAITLGLALVIRLTMSIVALLLGLIPAIQVRPVSAVQMLMLALIFILAAIPEELGWRGYALPKLLTHHTALVASLVIGVLWGTLHLALVLPGMMNEEVSPLATVLGLASGSVLFVWLYVNSNGNIVLTTIFHAAQSFFVIVNEGIPPEQQAWLMAGVYLALALIVAILTGPALVRNMAVQAESTSVSQRLAAK
jgi:membrane protease YdiL (CAAX protease family)